MNAIKTLLKYIVRFLEVFFGFLMFYLCFALVTSIISTGNLKTEGEMYIYVQSNGVHTDVCLPTETGLINWREFIPTNVYNTSKGDNYITIGWGDKGFFLDTPEWSDLTFNTAFTAAFTPSPTAMHVKYSSEPTENDNRVKVFLDKDQYQKMIKFIKNAFVQRKGAVELIANKGYSDNDNFYEAKGSYHLFRTCNIFTNQALKEADIKTGVWSLFPDGILRHLRE